MSTENGSEKKIVIANKIIIASDHAGFAYKQALIEYLNDFKIISLGAKSAEAYDYPLASKALSEYLAKRTDAMGILVCGTGIGVCIAANRFNHIRAAVCNSVNEAKLSREHNNANVICLGARLIDMEQAKCCVDTFLSTEFSKKESHNRRVAQLVSC